ncbi:MAG: aminoacyl-tRNA hydrolase [Mycoplasmatales bacterium]
MKLIVGLGNPEPKYDLTRHNIGFMILNEFAQKNGQLFKQKDNYFYCELNLFGEKVWLVKPNTYMNRSGEAVRKIVSFYNLELDDILVIHDDVDLNFTKLKIKTNSSAGGHNGIKDIINHLHSQKFCRLKFGIQVEGQKKALDYVLDRFSKAEQAELGFSMDVSCKIIEDFIRGMSPSELANKYH